MKRIRNIVVSAIEFVTAFLGSIGPIGRLGERLSQKLFDMGFRKLLLFIPTPNCRPRVIARLENSGVFYHAGKIPGYRILTTAVRVGAIGKELDLITVKQAENGRKRKVPAYLVVQAGKLGTVTISQ